MKRESFFVQKITLCLIMMQRKLEVENKIKRYETCLKINITIHI